MHLSPHVSLQISPSLLGNVLKDEFSRYREALKQHLHLRTLVVTISSLCRSTPTSNTQYELRPRSGVNLQPTQTSTLVSEALSGAEVHSCAVITPTQSFFLALKPPVDSTGRPRPSCDFPVLSPAAWCHCSGTTGAPSKGSGALSCWLIHSTVFGLLLPTGETLVNKGRAVILQSCYTSSV